MTVPNHCDFSALQFRAIAIETSGGRLIRVSGSGLCPTGGWQLRLVAANPGVVPHPDSLGSNSAKMPRRMRARVVTETQVEVLVEDSRADEVQIRFGWREGFTIPVVPARDAPRRHGARRRSVAARGRLAASVV